MIELVVGVDGSEGSVAALRWAGALASSARIHIHAVRAWEYPAHAALPGSGVKTLPSPDEADQEVRDELEATVVGELGQEARVRYEVARGPAAPAIVAIADRVGAHAVVVSRRRRSGLERAVLGSVSRRCLEEAGRGVVIVPPAWALSGALTSVVVGADGSDASRQAMRWLVGLEADPAPQVHAVHAHIPPNLPIGVEADLSERMVEETRAALDREWCAPLRDAGADYDTQLGIGDPRAVLVDAAREHDADLVVIGTKGNSPVKNLVIGSAANYLASDCPFPLAVVPPS